MFKKIRLFLLSSATAVFLFGSNQAYSAITTEGFESGSIANYKLEAEGKGSFQVISGDSREGNKFLRITKDKGARRYEIRLAEYSKPADLWYGFSVRLQPDMESPDDFLIISQWHNFPDNDEDWHKPDAFLRLNSDYSVGISNHWATTDLPKVARVRRGRIPPPTPLAHPSTRISRFQQINSKHGWATLGAGFAGG